MEKENATVQSGEDNHKQIKDNDQRTVLINKYNTSTLGQDTLNLSLTGWIELMLYKR